MPTIIDGTSGVDTIQNGIVTSAKIASGQTPSFNGIQFPATQAASADANTLDDYEEGTCTFTITSGVTSPSYNIQTGWYTKIGNTVFVTGRVDITSGTTNGNTLELGGLPFTILSSSNVFPVGTCYLSVAASGANSNVIPIPIAGTTTVQFYIQNTTNIAAFSGINFGSTGNVDFQFYYRVA